MRKEDPFFGRHGKGEVTLPELQELQREIFERCKTEILGSSSVSPEQRAEVMTAYATAAKAVAAIGELICSHRNVLLVEKGPYGGS